MYGIADSKFVTKLWNKNQLMLLFQFYSYIAGSLHVSGAQAHLQESSHSCSHNHWFLVIQHVEIRQYMNKIEIVTSAGFYSIRWKDALYKKPKIYN